MGQDSFQLIVPTVVTAWVCVCVCACVCVCVCVCVCACIYAYNGVEGREGEALHTHNG